MNFSRWMRGLLGSAVLMALALPVFAQDGQWVFVRTETYVQPYSGAYPDTQVKGGEGNLSVMMQEPSVQPVPTLATRFTWSAPPKVLVPGTVISWPLSAQVQQNVQGRHLGQSFDSGLYPYEPARDLAHFNGWATLGFGGVRTDSSMPSGKMVTYNNADQPRPSKVPGPGSFADKNGMITWLVWVHSSQTWYWSYVYQWVPAGSQGSTQPTNRNPSHVGANLALNKPSSLSSVYSGSYSASACNDGNRASMCHTQSEPNPWWQVDLQGNYAISEIVVFNRPDQWGARERTITASISTDGRNWQRIYTHDGRDFTELHIPANARSARYVRVGLNGSDYMNIMEVEVYEAQRLAR